MKLAGRVVEEAFAVGTKSEHRALKLDTGERTLVLRRAGANAFRDPVLARLLGKRIEAEGELRGSTLFLSDYRVLPD